MMRGMTILWTVLAVVIGIGLFLLKYEVKSLEGHLAGINRDIRGHQEAIHVLKAEWSYLNDPERLRDLNERHLAMKSLRGDQLVSVADLPMAPPRPAEKDLQDVAPEGRVMVDAAPAQPAPATRGLKPGETVTAKAPITSTAPAPAKTVVAAVPTATAIPLKPVPLKTETTPKPILGKSESVRSEALQSAFAAAKPANPKPVTTTPAPASVARAPVQPARLPSGAVVTQSASGDVMVIKSPALVAAEAAAGGQR